MEFIASPNPHFIPGYTGFCPQYKYRIGDTFGSTTHKVLLDPTVHHAEKLVLSDRIADDFKTVRPARQDIDAVNERQGDTIYKHPMVPGYEGFVPREHGQFGQRYALQATEALADFERLQNTKRKALNQILKVGYLHNNKWDPKTLEDKELAQSDFKLPLLEVRPECGGLLRHVPVTEPPITPPRYSHSPYFSDNIDPEKYLKSGFTGHIPFGYAAFGKTHQAMTNSALCDFTSNYRKRLSNEWAPVEINRPDPPVLIQPMEIYHRHVGQLPNYSGHIPGAIFRYGKTYGSDSRDAKRWLRGDFRT
ncbi:CIMIP2 protein CG18335-like isoform X2 [Cylas formicarius]|uniref:CIMIP2 protein CG18335-like isoform X2 n=1 Tax=Cylas formicarius TaxID=197179 RepID=UPI002958970F|nr:CIMIP2 protein CG18335-like isoform X2 [Cylas formicarius]